MKRIFDFLGKDWQKTGIVALISAAFSSITTYQFTDRDKSITEMDAYQRFVTEILVLNDHPAKRRMLAQYFAGVTPSYSQNKKWDDYYCEVEKDYVRFQKTDSLDKARLLYLLDINNPTKSQKWETEVLKTKLNQRQISLGKPIEIPSEKSFGMSNSLFSIYIQYKKGSESIANTVNEKLQNAGFNVLPMEMKTEVVDNDIRYYSSKDYSTVSAIIDLLKAEINLDLKSKNFERLNKDVKPHTLEVWIK
ncbi:hypothetical protein [Lacihabitans soyangensis]|uniref:Uncharacterized protein n=1 Tax=Lacihabitans soyangensis TaxID=869394 RepID=A0AAE3KSB8_9BACT|nr:hypothetical protein [Lacihabitans soyangensis]MCP9762414.1 hypothetical protein [Lacihabitans soyangensis]